MDFIPPPPTTEIQEHLDVEDDIQNKSVPIRVDDPNFDIRKKRHCDTDEVGKEKNKGKKVDSSSSKPQKVRSHLKKTKTPQKKEKRPATVSIRPSLPKVMVSSFAICNFSELIFLVRPKTRC